MARHRNQGNRWDGRPQRSRTHERLREEGGASSGESETMNGWLFEMHVDVFLSHVD